MAPKTSGKSRKTSTSKRAAASISESHEEEELLHVAPESVEATMLPQNLHPWLQFDRTWVLYNDYSRNLYYLLRKDFELARYVDWGPLEAIGLAGQIRELLIQRYEFMGQIYHFTEWEKLFAIRVPVFRELCFEFHSTIIMQRHLTTVNDREFMKFRLGGQLRSLSMKDLAACLGIYTPEELSYDFFDDYLMSGARVHDTHEFVEGEFWEEFSEKEFEASGVSHRDMNDVRLRIIHRCLAHTIANRRENTEKITLADIWYLRQIRERIPINIPYCVATYLKTLAGGLKDKSPICGGHFITLIAQSFRIDFGSNSGLTKVALNQKSVGYPMFHATRAVSKNGKNYIPFVEQPEQQPPPPRQRVHVQEQQQEHGQEQGLPEPSLLSIMQGIQGLQVHQNQFRDDFTEWRSGVNDWQNRMDYRIGNIEYQSSWNTHNLSWLAEQQGFSTTRAEPLYQWDTPESRSHPPPVYDPQSAIEEAQRRHQEEYERQLRQEQMYRDTPSGSQTWDPWPPAHDHQDGSHGPSSGGWGWPF